MRAVATDSCAKFVPRENFDDNEKMIVIKTTNKKAIYHSKMNDAVVHSIVASSAYARCLICSGENQRLGEEIFEKVISLQDTNPKSDTYGLWPYYLEEDLSHMDAPDKNMAGFNSREMLDVLFECGDVLNKKLKEKMLSAISAACSAIIMRNEGVQYTNVAFLESFVLCSIGEMTKNEKFLAVAREKLKKSLGFIHYQGSVFEHNSPCYSFLCVNDLGSIIKYARDKKVLFYANEINNYLWRCLAEHFDYKNLQLGGPQSRAYDNYLPKENLEIIASACGLYDRFKNHPLIPKDFCTANTNAVCPEEYIPYFCGEKVFRSSERIIMRGFNYPYFAFSQAINHYRGDGFTLGTFNREELWNQRRPLLSYIDGEKKPFCFRVKCYHDGYDFSSAVLHCVQKDAKVLGNINFSSDRGDTHIGLDLVENAAIEAEDLRIAFEIEGDAGQIDHKTTENVVELKIGNVSVKISHIYTKFGDYPVSTALEQTEQHFKYSIILYNGPKKKIEFGAMNEAISAFAIEMGKISEKSRFGTEVSGDFLKTVWDVDGDRLELLTRKSASAFRVNMYGDKQFINGKELFKHLEDKELQKG